MRKFILKLIFLLFTFYILHFTFYITPVYAENADIGYSRLHPASSLYFLKAVKENLELRFARTTKEKMLLELEFVERRLREAKTLIPINQSLMQSTLERYITTLNSLPDKYQEKDALGLKVKETLNIHLKVLEQMYYQASNLKAKMAIRSVMNRAVQRADADLSAKLPICSLFSQEASSSALNEVERVVLSERAQKCLNPKL